MTDSTTQGSQNFFIRYLTRTDQVGFVLRVIPLLTLLTLVTLTSFYEEWIQTPFMNFNALLTYWGINLFGAGAEMSGNKVWTNKFAVVVVSACTGQFTMLILFSMLVAFPAKLKMKIKGIVAGFSLIMVLNLVRLVSLFFIGEAYPEIFDDVHLYIWQAITIAVALIFWYLWAQRALRGLEPTPAQAVDGS